MGNASRWGFVTGITLLGVFLSASAYAAVFTVNSPFDVSDANPGNGVCETAPGNGVCTLRAAIQETNVLPGADTIILPPNTYLLTNVTELIITSQSNLTIMGAGALTTIIDGNKNVRSVGRVLRIDNQAIVSISGVTIRNGVDFGCGGIANDGELALTNSIVSGNSAIGTSNPSGSYGGGICTGGGGTLRLINSIVSGNSANGAGSQSGRSYGGGIYGIFVVLTNSTVSGNSAIGTSPSFGGGIYGTRVTLTDSTVSGNSAAGDGGGIYGFLDTTVTNSTVSGNGAAGNGGGIYNSDGRSLTLFNSTVSGNSAAGDGGGIYNFQNVSMDANLRNATITQNQAGSGAGGGIFNVGNPLAFFSTILAGNLGTECGGTITSNGNNLIGSVDCTVAGSGFTVADPKLGPLQNNGGPTQTHALLPGSAAIDASLCISALPGVPITDQRGFPRPSDGNNDGVAACDIGAFELQGTTRLVSAVLPSSRSVQVNTPATAFATVINTGQAAASCSIAPLTSIPANFQYQTTDPATNQVTGSPNTPVNIAAGTAQSFVLGLTPTAAFPPTDLQISFDCANSDPAPINVGLNTLLLSASDTPVPDIVALAATTTNDGIVNIPGTSGAAAFAVASVNVGAMGTITASADMGSATLPVNISLCQTDPATGQCISAIGPTVTTTINANATPTFGIFVQGSGNVPFDPAANRIFVRFNDSGGITRGSTSVAVRTQ
jgi:CSLREA domain-containing protein